MNRRSVYTMMAIGVVGFDAKSLARADEVLKFRAILHANSVQSQEVGDVAGHVFSVARFSGFASFPDGSVGTTYFTAETDYIKGSGTSFVFHNLTLKDGSELWYKETVTAKLDGTTPLFLTRLSRSSVERGGSKAQRAAAP